MIDRKKLKYCMINQMNHISSGEPLVYAFIFIIQDDHIRTLVEKPEKGIHFVNLISIFFRSYLQ